MTDSNYSYVWVLFLVLIFFFFFQNNNMGWGLNRGLHSHECGATANCDVQKSEITNSARTQYLIEQKGSQNELLTAQTKAEINANTNFWGIQQLNQRFEDERFRNQKLFTENSMLKSQIYNDVKFNELSNKIDSCCCESSKQFQRIELTALKNPPFYPVGFSPYSFGFPFNNGGCGFNNGFNGFGNYNNNGCCNG